MFSRDDPPSANPLFAQQSLELSAPMSFSGYPRQAPTLTEAAPQPRGWSSTSTDCLRDEESCWWGTWCCCLLAARTTETFGLGSAREQVYFVVALGVAVLVCLQLGLSSVAVLLLVVGGLYHAFRRTAVRGGIREALRIGGSYWNDFLQHLCCACCSVCQEAREAKAQRLKELDFCSGQELAELAVQEARPAETDSPEGPDLSDARPSVSLSQASQLVLRLCAAFFLFIAVRLAVTSPASLGVLLLVFVQPLLVLYYFYWRQRRRSAQLDYVVKLFAVGFFMATTQSVVFESLLQYVITIVAGIVFFLLNPQALEDSGAQSAGYLWGALAAGIERFSPSPAQSFASEWVSPQGEAYVSVSQLYSLSDSLSFDELRFSLRAEETDSAADDDSLGGIPRSLLRDNVWLLLIVLFLFAFVVAAGVEETMKYFVVRCCRFPAPLKDPDAILVYLLAGALGFATAENIEYVFGTKKSPIHGTSVFVGEVFVLFLRICLPVHLICAVLQAANLSRMTLGGREMNTLQVLLPAIILHGSFDFFLFAAGALQYVYDIRSTAFDVITFIFPFAISLGGIAAAKFEFDSVLRQYRSTWQPLNQEDDMSTHNVITTADV